MRKGGQAPGEMRTTLRLLGERQSGDGEETVKINESGHFLQVSFLWRYRLEKGSKQERKKGEKNPN